MKKILNTTQHVLTNDQLEDLSNIFGKQNIKDLRDVTIY